MAAPAKPADPVLVRVDVNRIVIRWTAPANGGAALRTYNVRHRTSQITGDDPRAAGTWVTMTGLPLTSNTGYEIVNLAPLERYDVQVAAVNDDGTGTYSDSLQTQTQEADTMARFNRDLTKIHAVLEAANAPGVLIDTPKALVPILSGSMQSMQDRETLDELDGVMDEGVDELTRQYTQMQIEQALDYENLIWALMCGVENENPTGATPNVWTFKPGVTAPVALRTATWYVSESDGSSHYRRRFGNARPTSIGISIPETGVARLNTTWMGRAAENRNATPTQGPLARNMIPVDLFQVYIDDAWGDLGDTAFGEALTMDFELNTGAAQAFTKGGRATLDPAGWTRARPTGVVSVTMYADSASAAELEHLRNGDLRFIRLEAEEGTGGGTKRLRIDAAVRYIEIPDELQTSEQQHTISFQGQIRADRTAANNRLEISVTNALAATAY